MGGSRTVLFVLLVSCVSTPRRHADTYLAHGYRFVGPRVLVVDARDDEGAQLQRAFARYGFKLYPAATRVHDYTLRVTGVCYALTGGSYVKSTLDEYSGGNAPEYLFAEVRGPRREKLFVAHLNDETDCPTAFFDELAAALDRNWEPEQLNAPAPP